MVSQKNDTPTTYPAEYTDATLPPDQSCSLQFPMRILLTRSWSSDIFSLGCVIADMFNKGQELFDLSNLLRYCNDDDYELSSLNRIDNEKVKVVTT